jgi:hypothetical protein
MTIDKSDILSLLNQTESIDIQIWHYILDSFPSDIWWYPVAAFLYRDLKKWNDLTLKEAMHLQYIQLLHNLARYIFAKGFGGDSIHGLSIKDKMADAIIKIIHGEPYIPHIEITDQFIQIPNYRLNFNEDFVLLWNLHQLAELKNLKRMTDVL